MRIIKQILLFGITFISIVFLSEIFIRTTHLANVSSTEFYDDIGRGRRKNLRYLYFNEGFGIGKFNKYRYIGEANPPEKPKNTIRIALLGDSYVESFQVFERNYFGNIAENILSKMYPEKQFEILNFGRSGFDIGNIYAYQKTFVDNFNPDFVLYFISHGDLEIKYTDGLRPKTKIKNDSLVVLFDFDPNEISSYHKKKILLQNSAILKMLDNGIKKAERKPISGILLDKIYTWINPMTEKLNTKSKSDIQINPVALKIIKSLDSKKVIFVNRSMEELPLEFKILCSDNDFNYIDLSKKLKEMKERGVNPKEWKITKKRGHWNQQAHKKIGFEIAQKMDKVIQNDTTVAVR